MKIIDTSGQDVTLDTSPRTRRNRTVVSLSIAGVVILGMMVLPAFERWSQAQASVPESRLRLAEVTRGDFTRDISIQGRVIAALSPTLYAPQDGTITYLVAAGDQVESGTALARVESPELESLLLRERSNLARLQIELERHRIQSRQEDLEQRKGVDLAKVSLQAADRERRRAEQAYARKAMSQIDFEEAHDELETATVAHQHALADAELNAERVKFELRTRQLEYDSQALLVKDLARRVDELQILSPVDGMVGNLNTDQKAAVTRNEPVLSVVDLSRFEIEAEVPESFADDLAIGMQGEVQMSDHTLPATLVAVSPEIVNNQVKARLRFNNGTPEGLRQNQRLSSRILLSFKRNVLTVPRGQFLETGAGRIAYVVSNGMAERRSIETGGRSLGSIEILSGLEEGETIVVSSTDLFRGADRALLSN